MSWHSRADGAPRIYNYEEAKHCHAKTKPIRGRAVEHRPLGSNRSKSPASIREEVVGGETHYVVKLYRTDIIRYKPAGTILVNVDGWVTQSTANWLSAILPNYFFSHLGDIWVRCEYETNTEAETNTETKTTTNRGCVPLRRNENNNFRAGTLLNPRFPVVHTMNRKEMNTVRREYKEFRDYMKGVLKVAGSWDVVDPGWQERRSMHDKYNTDEAIKAATLSGDTERFYALMIYFMRIGYSLRNPEKGFDHWLISAHADRVLDKHVITEGTHPVKDRYAWAVEDK